MRGVHFAVTADELTALRSSRGDQLEERLEDLEERWDEEWTLETDKAWDPVGRILESWPAGDAEE